MLDLLVDHLFDSVDDHVALIDNLLSPLVHNLFLIRTELAHAHRLLISIVVAEENLVFHKLQSGATFSQNDLILHLLHLVEFFGELVRDPLFQLLDLLAALYWL